MPSGSFFNNSCSCAPVSFSIDNLQSCISLLGFTPQLSNLPNKVSDEVFGALKRLRSCIAEGEPPNKVDEGGTKVVVLPVLLGFDWVVDGPVVLVVIGSGSLPPLLTCVPGL